MEWKKTHGTNEILDFDDWYVSFNDNLCFDISFFRSDTGGAETALCIDGQFMILNGDFRKEYEDVLRENPTILYSAV